MVLRLLGLEGLLALMRYADLPPSPPRDRSGSTVEPAANDNAEDV